MCLALTLLDMNQPSYFATADKPKLLIDANHTFKNLKKLADMEKDATTLYWPLSEEEEAADAVLPGQTALQSAFLHTLYYAGLYLVTLEGLPSVCLASSGFAEGRPEALPTLGAD